MSETQFGGKSGAHSEKISLASEKISLASEKISLASEIFAKLAKITVLAKFF